MLKFFKNNKQKFTLIFSILFVVILLSFSACSNASGIMYSLTLDGSGATTQDVKEIYFNATDGLWYSEPTGYDYIQDVPVPKKEYKVKFVTTYGNTPLDVTFSHKFDGYGDIIDNSGYIDNQARILKNTKVSATWSNMTIKGTDIDSIDLSDPKYILETTDKDMEFLGWSTDPTSTIIYASNAADPNYRKFKPTSVETTLYARWDDNHVYTLTLDSNKGTTEGDTEIYYSVKDNKWYNTKEKDEQLTHITPPKREYTIKYDTNPKKLSDISVVNPPKDDKYVYNFNRYDGYVESDGKIKQGATLSKDLTVSAMWTAQSAPISLKTPEAFGFAFLGWYEVGDTTETVINGTYPPDENGKRKDLEGDVTLAAKWQKLIDKHALTLNNNGATDTAGESTYIYYDTNFSASDETGSPWMRADGSTLTSIAVPKKEYTVTFSYPKGGVAGAEYVEIEGETTPQNDTATFAYTFRGYYDGVESYDMADPIKINYRGTGKNFNAVADDKDRTVILDEFGNALMNTKAAIEKDSAAIAVWYIDRENNTIKLPYLKRDGYEFLGWMEGQTLIGVAERTKIDALFNQYYPKSNVTLVASWKPNTYKINLDGDNYTGLKNSLPYNALYYTVGGIWSLDPEGKQAIAMNHITPIKKELRVTFNRGYVENDGLGPEISVTPSVSSFQFGGFLYTKDKVEGEEEQDPGTIIIDANGDLKTTFISEYDGQPYSIKADGTAKAIWSSNATTVNLPSVSAKGYRLLGWKAQLNNGDEDVNTMYVIGENPVTKFTPEDKYLQNLEDDTQRELKVVINAFWEKIKYRVEIEGIGSKNQPIEATEHVSLNNGDGQLIRLSVVPYVNIRDDNNNPTSDLEKYVSSETISNFVSDITEEKLNIWFEDLLNSPNFLKNTDGKPTVSIVDRGDDYITVRLRGKIVSTKNVVESVRLNIAKDDIQNNRLDDNEWMLNETTLYYKNAGTAVSTLIEKDKANGDVTTIYSGTRYYPIGARVGNRLGGESGSINVKITLDSVDSTGKSITPKVVFRDDLTSNDVKKWFAPLEDLLGRDSFTYAIVDSVKDKSEIRLRISGTPSISNLGTVSIEIPYSDLKGGDGTDTVDLALSPLEFYYNSTDYYNSALDITITRAEQNKAYSGWRTEHCPDGTIDQTMSFIALKGGIKWPLSTAEGNSSNTEKPSQTADIEGDFAVADITVTGGFFKVITAWAMDNGYEFRFINRDNDLNEYLGYLNEGENRGNRKSSVDPASIAWIDAVIFSNAVTEWYNTTKGGNLTFAYTADGTLSGEPVKVYDEDVMRTIKHVPGATGFRLPTRVEYQYFASVSPFPLPRGFNAFEGNGVTLPQGFYAQRYDGVSGDPTSTPSTISDTARDYAIYPQMHQNTVDYGSQAVGKYWCDAYGDLAIRPNGAKPNLLGLYDVTGNVFECIDDVISNSTSRYHVGGSWNNINALSAYNIGGSLSQPYTTQFTFGEGGLRLVKSL